MRDPSQLAITRIELDTEASVDGLDEGEFREIAEQAKQNCPVSKALAGVQIVLVNRRFLPAAVRGARWREAGVLLCSAFYAYFAFFTFRGVIRSLLG